MISPPEAYVVAYRKACEKDKMKGLPVPIQATLANALADSEDETSSQYAESVASEHGLAPPTAVRSAFGASHAQARGAGLSQKEAVKAAHDRQVEFASTYHAAIQRGDPPDIALTQAQGLV